MTDWRSVSGAGLSVLGASIALGVLSYYHWLNREIGKRWSELRVSRSWRLPFRLGLAIFCLGYAVRATGWLETALWTALAAFSFVAIE